MYQKRYAPRTSTLLFHALTNYMCANFTTLLQTDLVFLQLVLQRPNRRNVWRRWFRTIRSIHIAWKPLWCACVWPGAVMDEHFWSVSCGTNPTKESIHTSQCYNTAVRVHRFLPDSFTGTAAMIFPAECNTFDFFLEGWRAAPFHQLPPGFWFEKLNPIFIPHLNLRQQSMALLSSPLSAFISVRALKEHWILNALTFQLPLSCLDRHAWWSIIHLLCNGRCSSKQQMSSITAAQGWLLRHLPEVLFLLLLPSTVASPYT
jgi:hypothetical protein